MQNIIVLCSSALSMGISLNNMNSDILKLYYMELYDITFLEADVRIQPLLSIFTSISLISFIISSFSMNIIAKVLSLKTMSIISSFLAALASFLSCIVVSESYLLVLRAFDGFFTQLFCNINLILITSQKTKHQNIMGTFYTVMIVTGILFTSLILLIIRVVEIKYQKNIFYVNFIISGVFPMISFIFIFFIKVVQIESSTPKKQKLIIFTKKYYKMTILAFFLGVWQQVCAANAVQSYATETFKDTFISPLSSVYGSLIINGIIFASTTISLFFAKGDRRIRLYITTTIIVICQFLLIINYSVKQSNNILLLFSSIVFVFSFGLGPGPIYWAYMSDLFPEAAKQQLVAVGVFGNYSVNFVVLYMFPVLTDVAAWVPFLTYFVSTIVSTVIIGFLLPVAIKEKNVELEVEVVPEELKRTQEVESEFTAVIN